jgi:GNAT superfamily N-acetyltransferase
MVEIETMSRHASTLQVREVEWEDPAAAGLRTAMSAELDPLYADQEARLGPLLAASPEEIALTLVVEDGDEPVACGSLRTLAEPVDVDGAPARHEVKKLYVAPGHRRRGLATLLLAELRAAAGQAGGSAVVLHTGTLQPEAAALYEARGWREIPAFGSYAEVADLSVCFGAPTAVPAAR